jgi:hypothetical protein
MPSKQQHARGCAAAPSAPAPAPAAARAAAAAAARGSVTLPNGLTIQHASTADEALFLYRENWVERVYLRRGVALKEGDIVVDVGANIGLFATAAAEVCCVLCLCVFALTNQASYR